MVEVYSLPVFTRTFCSDEVYWDVIWLRNSESALTMRKKPNYVQKSLCYGIDTVIHGRKEKILKNVRERNNKNKLESIEEQAKKKI